MSSRSPAVALLLGWHPWSVCRGAGYVLIAFAVASVSLRRLMGRRPRRGAGKLLIAGMTLLIADGVLKLLLLETVRQSLAANLL
jgi:hypothetical protein